MVTILEFSICYNIILRFFLQDSKYLQIIKKLHSNSLSFLWNLLELRKGNNSCKNINLESNQECANGLLSTNEKYQKWYPIATGD